jgi:DNA-binding NarL/FixJ family response regulator
MEMCDTLEKMGCQIVGPAAHIDNAFELAQNELIDFAVLDVNLNRDTSFPVANIFRKRQIPFMFVTGDRSSILAEYANVPVRQARVQPPVTRSIIALRVAQPMNYVR